MKNKLTTLLLTSLALGGSHFGLRQIKDYFSSKVADAVTRVDDNNLEATRIRHIYNKNQYYNAIDIKMFHEKSLFNFDIDRKTLYENAKPQVTAFMKSRNITSLSDIFNFMKSIKYETREEKRGKLNAGFAEEVQTPMETALSGSGDCDDVQGLGYVMCQILGIPSKCVIMKEPGKAGGHLTLAIKRDENDTSLKNAMLGIYDPKSKNSFIDINKETYICIALSGMKGTGMEIENMGNYSGRKILEVI